MCVSGAGFTTLFWTGGDKAMGNGKSLEGIIREQQSEIGLSRVAIIEQKRQLSEGEERRTIAKEAEQLAVRVKAGREKIAEITASLPRLEQAIKDLEESMAAEKLLYRKQLLNDPAISTLAELRTISGKIYQNVRITSIDATSVTISHQDGSGRISLAELPAEIRKRFP
ncbi:MAG: hypothetical protein CFE26_12960 [Verrucomicrobiales bacterium VVV1]|nr:MAG: hypothetical protein CFE26_12960 [Verrucomicrobiales bacterium VVV1]